MNTEDNQSSEPVKAAIQKIASDNASGAAEILSRAGAVFALLNARSSGLQESEIEVARGSIAGLCAALALAQPGMSSLLRLASAALCAARIAIGAQQALQAAQDAALNFVTEAERASRKAAMHAAGLVRDDATVLTHSRSSTVLAALTEAKQLGRRFSVVVTESRPGLEGRALAETLASQGVNVTLIADAAASLALNHVNLIFVGADKLTPLSLVNKIGTRMIALAARERSLPVFAICDTSKFIREDYCGTNTRDLKDPAELWSDAPRGVLVDNRYFEPAPLDCFAGIITEDGVLSVEEAARQADEASIDQELVNALAMLRERIK